VTKKVSEAQTLNTVIEYLRLRHVPHARVNNTGVIIQRKGRTFFGRRKHEQKGVADILGCYKGWALALEIKAHGEKQRPEQIEFQIDWQKGGGIYAVIYDVEQVERILGVL
jgi:hypothetical protein